MRKTENITIVDADKQTLKFVVTQMPAMQLHDFTLKVGLLLLNTEFAASMSSLEIVGNIGEKIAKDGLSLLRGIGFEATKPLINELLACCSRVADTGVLQQCTPETFEGISDDPTVIFKLEMEAVKLNFSFFSQMFGGSNITHAVTSGAQPGANASL